MLRVATISVLLAATGCGAVESSSSQQDQTSARREMEDFAEKPPAMWAKYEAFVPACGTPAPMLVHHDESGRVDRLHATLTARGVTGHYLVDTGSLKSFATHTGNEDGSSAKTVIACTQTTLPIIARLRPGSTPEGLPQAGVLGSDLVRHGSVLDLDLKIGALGWYHPAPAAPAGAVVLPIERRKNWLVASGIRVSGRDVKLVVDTGASNIIIVDKTPRPNEVREETVDGTAAPITLFHGAGEVTFTDGLVRHAPVDRTDNFKTLEDLIAALGGDVAGLLGLTAMGRDRIVIAEDAMYLVLPPEVPSPR